MQGSFMAGVLQEFHRGGIKPEFFDLYVCTSAGAFCCAYFLTNQVKEGIRVFEKHLPKGFIGWKNFHPYYDLNYLKKILTEIEPLDLKRLKKLKSPFMVSLTRPGRKNPDFFDLRKVKDPICVLLACASAPILSDEMNVDGKVYFDGGFKAQPPIHYPGLNKYSTKLVLLTYPKGYQLKPWAWEIGSLVLARYPELRAMVKEAPVLQNLAMRKIEKSKKLLVIRPKETLPGHWLEREAINIKKNVKLGNIEARNFLKTTKSW